MNFCYKFPVVKGMQAGRPYYIAMVPMNTLEKLFPNETEYVLPEHRAQRRLNETRIPEIKNYILENRDSYVFSALAASIDGAYKYIGINQDNLGILEVDMNAKFLINDGQHRKAAIVSAIKEEPDLGEETIAVVFYEDLGLSRSQQMFTDLNKHAIKTSNSLAELYDSRNMDAVATRRIISEISFLEKYVDKENDYIGKNSSALFTLKVFSQANKKILGKRECNSKLEEFQLRYWQAVIIHMIPWQDLENKRLTKKDLREQYIAVQAVIIKALGRVGNSILENGYSDEKIVELEKINWRRSAPIWRGRVIGRDGKILTSNAAIILAANVIKKTMGLELTEDEEYVELKLKRNKK